MNHIRAAALPLGLSLALALFFILFEGGIFSGARMTWHHKEEEVASRLLAVPILLYHNIDGRGPFSIASPSLRSHFSLFRERGLRVIPLGELIRRMERPAAFDDRAMVITFDDGYPSMYWKLLPMAGEFGFPVTLFVYADTISTGPGRGLTWARLREMDGKGIDIQSHSISHPDLTRVSKKGGAAASRRLYEEIYLSKRIIELRLGKEIEYFAFPYGRYNAALVSLALDAGYRRVFSTDYGSNVITRDNSCLRRQHVKSNYSLGYIENLIR
ncbi:MAG: polysaccharide deacetylase family protein [Spirochaetes bacterium]|nr:polysaccharide deacetylase family protein [Spirochaetota bacterium]